MRNKNRTNERVERFYGSTLLEKYVMLFVLICGNVVVFNLPHLIPSAGWMYMMIVVVYLMHVLSSTPWKMLWRKMVLLLKKQASDFHSHLVDLGELALTQEAIYRYLIISSGGILSFGIYIPIGVHNLEIGVYDLLPWVVALGALLMLTIFPLIGIYLYQKKNNLA